MGVSVNTFAVVDFSDHNFSVEDLNNTTLYDVFEENDMGNVVWMYENLTFTENTIHFSSSSDPSVSDDVNYTITAEGYLSFPTPLSWNEGTGTEYIRIIDQNATRLQLCWEQNISLLGSCTYEEYFFFNEAEANATVNFKNQAIANSTVMVAEFDNDNNAQYSANDTIFIQFNMPVSIAELVIGEVSATDGSPITLAAGTNIVPVNLGTDVSSMPNFVAVTNDGNESNTFVITLGSGTTLATGDKIVIASANISALDIDVEFPLLAVADVATLAAEVENIRTQLNAATDMPADMRTAIETLLSEADALLAATTLDENALVAKLAEIYAIVDTIGDSDAYLYGTNASKLSGTITLPTPTGGWTAEADCFDSTTYMPLPTCNAVFLDLKGVDGEWLGSTMVPADGNYTLYFRELATSEELNATLEFHIHVDGVEEHYFYDFGAGHDVGTDDSFKSGMEVQWVESTTNPGMWIPDVNHLSITTSPVSLDFDISNMDANNFVVEGTVVVPSDFTPGEIFNSTTGAWEGFQMVNLTAIDINTGQHYWTEISRNETSIGNNTYPFKFKLPNSEGNYTIRIEKFSDTGGATEWLEMYLKDTDNHAFDSNETLISATTVQWSDIGNDKWIPDPTVAGYFTVSANVSNIAIDITSFGSNFYKIAGAVTPPSGFDMSDYHNNMNVDILDAKTGWWLGGSPVMCDSSGANCTYSVVLGDALNNYDGAGAGGYIVQMHQNHWDETNWENSWWKGFYLDFGSDNAIGGVADTILDEIDVRWTETTQLDSNGYPYWKPDVNELNITSGTLPGAMPSVDISFGSYVAPTTYTVSGSVSGIPSNAKWANVHLYDPLNYTGSGSEIKSDGTFSIPNVKDSGRKYILEVNYDVEDSGTYRHYHYIITDDDGDFTSGTSAVDGMDIKWIPYDSSGNSLESSTYNANFDWSTVSFWAPEETSSQKVMLTVSSNISVGAVAITQATLYNLSANVTGLANGLNVDFNLFVPNEPIGRWKNTTSSSTEANATLKDLKSRTDYQLQVWIEGLGEFWYDVNKAGGAGLVSDVYWVGKYESNSTICDDWKNNIFGCDYSLGNVLWGPNIDGFTINTDTTLTLPLPNDRAKVTATLDLSSLSLSNGTYVHVNMWEQNGNGYAWDEYAVSNNEVNVSMSVKHSDGGDYKYRMELWIPDTFEGYVVDLGTDTNVGGGDDKLITQHNSWNTSGAWGPKSTTLIPVNSAADIALSGSGTNSGLVPPSLSTLTFTVENLDGNTSGNAPTEQIFIDLEGLDGSNNSTYEWYGKDNANWSDWQNPTFSDTITVKVPNNANGYRVMVHPQNHKGGLINNGDTTANDVIANGATVTNFSWDWSKADKITVAGNQAYTIQLPSAVSLKSVSGTVSGITGGDMRGWIHAWSPTVDGNGAEVNATGSFTIKGLTAADDYTVEYWSWTQSEHIKIADVNVTNNVTGLSVAKSTTVHTFSGTLINNTGSAENMSVLLIEVDDNDSNGIDAGDPWEVIDDVDVGTLADGADYNYTFNTPPALSGYVYAIAVGVKTVESSGATTYAAYNSIVDSNNSDTVEEVNATAVTIDYIDTNATIGISVKEVYN